MSRPGKGRSRVSDQPEQDYEGLEFEVATLAFGVRPFLVVALRDHDSRPRKDEGDRRARTVIFEPRKQQTMFLRAPRGVMCASDHPSIVPASI